ncbi:hypothetical protein GCM10018966_062700 [Streptomyces yanii]
MDATKLLADGISTDHPCRQELRLPAYPSSIDLSTHTLRYLTGQLIARRLEIGTRSRRPTAGRQALLALGPVPGSDHRFPDSPVRGCLGLVFVEGGAW